MIRDTEIIIAGRKALVFKEHAKTFLNKEKLVAEASLLNRMLETSPEVLPALEKLVAKIQRINRKIARENMFVKFI